MFNNIYNKLKKIGKMCGEYVMNLEKRVNKFVKEAENKYLLRLVLWFIIGNFWIHMFNNIVKKAAKEAISKYLVCLVLWFLTISMKIRFLTLN
jgi:uncharacterized membrane protein YqgA involved in biofilm formation